MAILEDNSQAQFILVSAMTENLLLLYPLPPKKTLNNNKMQT